VLAHTALRSALGEYARTTARHGTAAPIGYYTFSQRARRVLGGDSRVRQSCALGSDAGTRGPSAPRIRYSNGSRSTVRHPQYSKGTRRVLAGYSWARAWNDLRRGSGRGRAAHSHWVLTEYEHARGYCQRYRVPHGAGPLRGRLPAYSRPRAARARARQSGGAFGRTQGCLRTPTGRRSHAHARARHRARAAGAQANQQVERRQRGGDRAVERVRAKRPATCMVRPAVQRNAHSPVRATHSHQHSSRWPHGSSSERALDPGTRGGAARVPSSCPADERYSSRAAVRTHPPWYVYGYSKGHQRLTRTDPCCEGTRTAVEGALARCSHTRPCEAHWASTHVPRHGTARRRR
jgi:hypothetical protein